jgi:WD40 repeat protein
MSAAASTSSSILSIAEFPDNRLISANAEGLLQLWDPDTLMCVDTIPTGTYNAIIIVLPNGHIACATMCCIRIYDPTTKAEVMTLYGHKGPIYCAAVLPTGRLLTGASDATLRVWNTSTGECVAVLTGAHKQIVQHLAVFPGGKRFVTGGDDGVLCVWESETLTCTRRLRGSGNTLYAIAALPDGTIACNGGTEDEERGSIEVWDSVTGNWLRDTEPLFKNSVTVMTVDGSGRLVCGSDKERVLQLIQPMTGVFETLETSAYTTALACLASGAVVGGDCEGTLSWIV